jgi:hypothetical protein
MAHHPTRQKFIIARVELVLAEPVVVSETIEELRVFEDDSAVGGCAARETWKTTVDVRTRADFDVPDCQTESRKDFPYCHAFTYRLHALTGTNASNLLVLKACEHIWQHGRWPYSIIICEDNNICGSIPNPMGHLQSLIRERDGEDANAFWINSVR